MATAPTLLLTRTEHADADDAASTSRIVTPPAKALEEQPWFKTGATVPPPEMRPMAESLTPPPARRPPSPRVLKVVAAVIAGCLLIVAMAGLKLLYKRLHAPAPQSSAQDSTSHTVMASVDLAKTERAAPEIAPPAEALPSKPESAPAAVAQTAPATQVGATQRTTPVRPSPTRVTTKTTTRRAPVTKKTGRGTH